MKYIVLLIVLIVLNFATNSWGQNLTIVDIQNKQIITKGLVSLKDAIVLDANKNCFFGEISCVVPSKSGYYILDARKALAVYKFDSTGKFCHKYGNLGKGPGEYVNPVWISVDESVNQLIIFDPAIQKLLIYNAQTSAFIKEIKLGFTARSFQILKNNGGFIFYSGFLFGGYPIQSQLIKKNMGYQFIITDINGQVKSFQRPYPNTYNPQNFIGMTEVFSSFGNVTTAFTPYNDTLYMTGKNGTLLPEFLIDYGNDNQKLSTDFRDKIGPLPTDFERNNQWRADSGIFQLAEQLQTKTHLQLTGIKGKSLFNYLVDKKSLNVLDLVKNKQTLKFGFRASDENYYYSVAMFEAFNKLGEALYNEYPPLLRDALKRAEVNDNPIVLVWEVKSF